MSTPNQSAAPSAAALFAAVGICEAFNPPSVDSELDPARDSEWIARIIDSYLALERAKLREALLAARARIVHVDGITQVPSPITLEIIDAALAL